MSNGRIRLLKDDLFHHVQRIVEAEDVSLGIDPELSGQIAIFVARAFDVAVSRESLSDREFESKVLGPFEVDLLRVWDDYQQRNVAPADGE